MKRNHPRTQDRAAWRARMHQALDCVLDRHYANDGIKSGVSSGLGHIASGVGHAVGGAGHAVGSALKRAGEAVGNAISGAAEVA